MLWIPQCAWTDNIIKYNLYVHVQHSYYIFYRECFRWKCNDTIHLLSHLPPFNRRCRMCLCHFIWLENASCYNPQSHSVAYWRYIHKTSFSCTPNGLIYLYIWLVYTTHNMHGPGLLYGWLRAKKSEYV